MRREQERIEHEQERIKHEQEHKAWEKCFATLKVRIMGQVLTLTRTHISEKASCSVVKESKEDESHVLGQIKVNNVNHLLPHLFEGHLNI